MTNETSSTPAPTRRSVLRAGAHAAWAVPAVQIATMVPAFATSGSPGLKVTATVAKIGTTSGRRVTFKIKVTGAGSVTGINLAISNNSPEQLAQTPLTDGVSTPVASLLATVGTVQGASWGIAGSGDGPYHVSYSGPGLKASTTPIDVVVDFSTTNTLVLLPGSDRRIKTVVTAIASTSGTLDNTTPILISSLA